MRAVRPPTITADCVKNGADPLVERDVQRLQEAAAAVLDNADDDDAPAFAADGSAS